MPACPPLPARARRHRVVVKVVVRAQPKRPQGPRPSGTVGRSPAVGTRPAGTGSSCTSAPFHVISDAAGQVVHPGERSPARSCSSRHSPSGDSCSGAARRPVTSRPSASPDPTARPTHWRPGSRGLSSGRQSVSRRPGRRLLGARSRRRGRHREGCVYGAAADAQHRADLLDRQVPLVVHGAGRPKEARRWQLQEGANRARALAPARPRRDTLRSEHGGRRTTARRSRGPADDGAAPRRARPGSPDPGRPRRTGGRRGARRHTGRALGHCGRGAAGGHGPRRPRHDALPRRAREGEAVAAQRPGDRPGQRDAARLRPRRLRRRPRLVIGSGPEYGDPAKVGDDGVWLVPPA